MTVLAWGALVWGGLGLGLGWLLWPFAYWILGRVQRLRDCAPPSPPSTADWPRLSVIIPACNEADTLESALGSLLAQDYPQLQIILVDDRSSDGSGEVMKRVAAGDPRVSMIRVDSLPEGWLGKVHAMHRGLEGAEGSWLLFSDADVHFEAGALRRAMAFAVHEDLAHLALLPKMRSETFWGRVALEAFGVTFFAGLWRSILRSRQSDSFIGIGAFNLVRRDAFEQTPGFEWLKLELADDMGLGLMLHQSGARSRFLSAGDALQVTWYRSYREMARGLEKNAFPLSARFSLLALLGLLSVELLLATGPLVLALRLASPLGALLGASALLPIAAYALRASRRFGVTLLPGLAAPLGQLMLCHILLRSAARCQQDGGITWRGTRYPTEALKQGQKVKLNPFHPL